MEVILLASIAKRGKIGDIIRVKSGFARNYLLPQGLALRATEANKEHFETQRLHLEEQNQARKTEAEIKAKELEGKSFVVIRQAGEGGQLYGSVSSRDIAALITQTGVQVSREHVVITHPVKTIGLHHIPLHLHADVNVVVVINVARSSEEAEWQARGEAAPARETTPIEDLGLEIGAALAEAEGA